MKKILFLIFFAFISFSLFAGLSYELYTNNVKLNWDKVDNAVYYDIYVGTKPLVRLTKGELTYTVKNLDQNSDYTITTNMIEFRRINMVAGNSLIIIQI